MLTSFSKLVALLALFAFGGCSLSLDESKLGPSLSPDGGVSNVTPETKTGLPCDVDAVIKTQCQTCHSNPPQFGAPNPLVTWEDFQAERSGKKVFELVKARIHDDTRPMPPSPKERLQGTDLQTVDGWLSGGTTKSPATCRNQAAPDGVKALSCTPDTVLSPPKPFTLDASSPLDQYICFGFDVEASEKRHVVAFAPKVDNKQIVHHVLLFQTRTSQRKDHFECGNEIAMAQWKLVSGWAPGTPNFELPPEAGFPEEKGTTHWVVQVHYNATVKTGSDSSGYELCTTDALRPNDAGFIAFGAADNPLEARRKFSIPPRSTHSIQCDYKLGKDFKNTKLFNAWPHMHQFGTAVTTERVSGGTPEILFEQKAFSFEAQVHFPVSKTVNAGDMLRTHCSWKNTTDSAVGFGEGTGDEMCFNFFAYYPAIPDRVNFLGYPDFTWITPSIEAQCSEE